MSLIHIIFPEIPKEILEHKLIYKSIIENRNTGEEFLLNQLRHDRITKKEYITAIEIHKSESLKEIRQHAKTKRALAYKYSFNGRSSFSYWIFVFGLSLSFFVLTLRYVYFNLIYNRFKTLRRALLFESSAWLTVSFFWLLHSVITRTKDCDSTAYLISRTYYICFYSCCNCIFYEICN